MELTDDEIRDIVSRIVGRRSAEADCALIIELVDDCYSEEDIHVEEEVTLAEIKSIPQKQPASKPEIMDALRSALEKAGSTEVQSVSIVMHIGKSPESIYVTIEA